MIQRNFKRVGVINDLHSGHMVGLTPPQFQLPFTGDPRNDKLAHTERVLWSWYSETVARYKPFDITIVNGDSIDGKGSRSGGTELLTSDRDKQTSIAAHGIQELESPIIVMTHGTPYHVGSEEDWESIVADKVNAKEIRSHGFWNINGVEFDVKHKIASSTVPHGRLTALAREIMWNREWAIRGLQPKADILIRSHTHYKEQVDHDQCLGFITPSLQGFGGKYGARQCSGIVDFGFLVFDIYEDGTIIWEWEILEGEVQERKSVSL